MSEAVRLMIETGPRPGGQIPIAIAAPHAVSPGTYILHGEGDALPAEVRHGILTFVLQARAPGHSRVYVLEPKPLPATCTVTAVADRLDVGLQGAPFASLHLVQPRPFLHPVHAPGGRSVVRGWPVTPEPQDRTDHIHHRGIWVAHGDINGTDAWADTGAPATLGHLHVTGREFFSGPTCAEIRLELDWRAGDATTVAHESRHHRFWATDGDARAIDIASSFTATDRPLRFGDTKEGGLVAVRVAAGLEGDRGGTIRTAAGAIGERQAWGSAAAWCDYSGHPSGGDQSIGIAVCGHPENPLAPTRWHVREYGLMAANPFALSAYQPDCGLRGDWEIPAAATATFRHRLIIHRGDAVQAEIAARYLDWVMPPVVRWRPT